MAVPQTTRDPRPWTGWEITSRPVVESRCTRNTKRSEKTDHFHAGAPLTSQLVARGSSSSPRVRRPHLPKAMFASRLLSRLGRAAVPTAALACGATAAAVAVLPAWSEPAVKAQSWDTMFNLPEQKSIAGKTALITGCSAGIGKATACGLASSGCNLVLVARRAEKLEELKAEINRRVPGVSVTVVAGDVNDDALYEKLVALKVPQKVDILFANAGLALGKETVGSADLSDWKGMMDANCLGAFRLIDLCLPEMVKRGGGHVLATGSIAGLESYEGGSVYCASKHALHAFMKALRFETYAKNIKVTVVAPGFVGEGTEFSEVRFKGDKAKAVSTYENLKELRASDVAAQVLWAVRQPDHVNVDLLQVMPTDQGSAQRIHRARRS